MRFALTTSAALLVGCGTANVQPDLPPLLWQGERVRVGTSLVPEVCQGTLVDLDANLALIETELGLQPEGVVDVYVLEDDALAGICPNGALACTEGMQVFFSAAGYRWRRHELVHARLIGIMGLNSIPLFDEGIAAAMDRDGGCRAIDSCDILSVETLLAAKTTYDLFELGGYTAASDLVRGMLDAYGAPAVLDFLRAVPQGMSPDAVRGSYFEHFGTAIEDDYASFKRDRFDDYTLVEQSCAPLTNVELANGVFEIEETMDCASAQVINDFSDPTRGQMTLGLEIPELSAGYFDGTWSATDGVPELSRCVPAGFSAEDLADLGPWTLYWTLEDRALLSAGWHTLRWNAAFGSTLLASVGSTCVHETQNCSTQEQCDIWNDCLPLGPELAGLGEQCIEDSEAVTCEVGARCLGGTCLAECDGSVSCADGQACARIGVCGPVCDLLAQDCMPGHACTPSASPDLLEAGAGVCVPEGPGFFEGCDPLQQACAAGLTCERYGACSPPLNQGCCVPLCVAGTSEPGCPWCEPIAASTVGFCSSE